MVINLTEKYNKDYALFTKSELDIYLGLKKTIENSENTHIISKIIFKNIYF